MIKFAEFHDGPIAYELVRRLEAASIKATVTIDTVGLYVHSSAWNKSIVWLDTEANTEKALEIYRELIGRKTFAHCPNCNYDMRGHAGVVNCPECGLEFAILTLKNSQSNRECTNCGESVPGNFDICWNCGAEVDH